MVTLTDLRLWAAFVQARGAYVAWGHVTSALVLAHVGATSRTSTPNILGEMLRENLELGIRRLEQKQHTLKTRYERIGKKIAHDD